MASRRIPSERLSGAMRGAHRRLLSPLQAMLLVGAGLLIVGLIANSRIQRSRQNRRLVEAVWNSNVETVQQLLDQGADPNACEDKTKEVVGIWDVGTMWENYQSKTDAIPASVLLIAADQNSVPVAKLLLERGADLRATGNNGGGVLTWTSAPVNCRNPEMIQFLLERGADRDAKDLDGATALHRAAERGKLPEIRLLLERGANVNSRQTDGTTPLMLAAQFGHYDAVQLLLDYGADAKLTKSNGAAAVDFARASGDYGTAPMLERAGSKP